MKKYKLYLKDYGFSIRWFHPDNAKDLKICEYFLKDVISDNLLPYYSIDSNIKNKNDMYKLFVDNVLFDKETTNIIEDRMIDILKPYIEVDEETAFYIKLKYS